MGKLNWFIYPFYFLSCGTDTVELFSIFIEEVNPEPGRRTGREQSGAVAAAAAESTEAGSVSARFQLSLGDKAAALIFKQFV